MATVDVQKCPPAPFLRRSGGKLNAKRLRSGRVELPAVVSSKTSRMPPTAPTASDFRLALGQFATGVTVVTAERAPRLVHGMTANSFTSVSLDPLLILICVSQTAQLLPLINRHKRFGVNVLKDSQQAVSEYFAQTEDNPDAERAFGVRYRWTPTGIPLLEDALAHLACNVVASYIAGDHTIFIAEVESIETRAGQPLLYLRGDYRRLS
jgi:flavin reductase (DIM6/NTAB) family NADH-FMN oxidoreductase RutF